MEGNVDRSAIAHRSHLPGRVPHVHQRAHAAGGAHPALLFHHLVPFRVRRHQPGPARLRRQRLAAGYLSWLAGPPPARPALRKLFAGGALHPLSLLIYGHTPFYPLLLLEEKQQWVWLLAYYLGAGVPFFLAGLCVSGAISAAASRVSRVYCADLVGAGLGAGLVVPLIWRFETPGVVMIAAGLMAAAALCWAWWWRPAVCVAPLALIVLLSAAGGRFWRSIEFLPSAEKMMAMSGAVGHRTAATYPRSAGHCRLLPQYTRWGAVFRVDVVEPMDDLSRIGCYYVTGASSQTKSPVPAWVTIPHDGDANAMIYDGRDPRRLAFLTNHALTLPYRLAPSQPRVLVIGAGGGTDVLAALHEKARAVTAIELDPLTAKLATRQFAAYSGGLFHRPHVRMVVAEGRSFISHCRDRFDLIVMNSTDTLTAMTIGANVLNENFLYTTEAFGSYLNRLDEGGLLCLMHLSAREVESLKYRQAISRAGAVEEALRRRGVANPRNHLAVVYANGLLTYLARLRAFTPQEVALLEHHCRRNGFEPQYLPYRRLDNELSWFLRARPAAKAAYMSRSPLVREAPTDDKPFIWPHYKWRYVLHPSNTFDRRAVPTGQLIMLPLLAVAVVGSLILVLGPLAIFRRRGVYSPQVWGLGLYFAALGVGFMFVEVSFIQRFALFLGYPTYSLTIVLSALLVTSGVGSLASRRLISRAEQSLLWALVGLLGLGTLYLLWGGAVFQLCLGMGLAVRIAVTVAMIAPLGFAMGMFFPTGVRIMNEVAPQFVPWAWGINACMSVIAAVMAVMLAMSIGFRAVGLLALGIYVLGVAGLYVAHRQAPRKAEQLAELAPPERV